MVFLEPDRVGILTLYKLELILVVVDAKYSDLTFELICYSVPLFFSCRPLWVDDL